MRFAIQILCFLTALTTYSQSRLLKPQQFDNQTIDKDWIYIKYKDHSQDRFAANKLVTTADKSSHISRIFKLKVPKGVDPITFCNELRRSTDLEYADPILKYI
ncbi:MAG: hypothetical protein HRT61_20650, partial [Ekhidna sp.]|nr:hypothetical protein [Ekhidna sp.]